MNKLIALSLLLIICVSVSAQKINLRIVIKNTKGELVQNTTATILSVSDSGLVFKKVLQPNTTFQLVQNNSYNIKISAIGIKPITSTVQIGNTDTTINLLANIAVGNLDVVQVVATKPLVKEEEDKTIVDAEQLAVSSTNGFEVLEKTPGVIIDQDGNIFLNTNSPAIVYINGKELRLSSAEVTTLLKNLPSNAISKIEILRNPSAKFDAASSGGIVNIILKKGVKLGTNGSIDVSYFQGVYATKGLGINVTKNVKKINTYFTYNFNKRTGFDYLRTQRFSTDKSAIYYQNLYLKLPAINNFMSTGIGVDVTEKLSLAYDVRVTINNNKSSVYNNIYAVNAANLLKIAENVTALQNAGPTFLISNSVSSKYKINERGSIWDNSIDYTFFKNRNTQHYSTVNILPAKNTLFEEGVTKNNRNIITLKSDIVYKLKKQITVEAGTKINLSFNNNNALYVADTSTGKYIDKVQTNGFTYNENIAAVYLQIAKTIKGITIKPGLRFEYTDIKGTQLLPTANSFFINRKNLFPYLFIRSKIGKVAGYGIAGSLIIRRSITRPTYEALNPYAKFADQYTYDLGNPKLQPQFTNNFELNFTANEIPIFTAGINKVNNIFGQITYQKGDTLFRTYDNLGKNKEAYFKVVFGIPPGKKYFFYTGAQLNLLQYNGFYNQTPFTYKRNYGFIFMSHNYKASPTLNLSLFANIRVTPVQNFFEIKTFGSVNLSANKSILNKKMSIALSLSDAFRTVRNTFEINQPSFSATGYRYGDSRRGGITLKYNFGLKPKEEKKQRIEMPQDMN